MGGRAAAHGLACAGLLFAVALLVGRDRRGTRAALASLGLPTSSFSPANSSSANPYGDDAAYARPTFFVSSHGVPLYVWRRGR